MKVDSRGFNLISVVTALAVFSILMATISVMYRNMVEMSLQAEITHEADSMIRTIQDILSSNQLCHRAIRGANDATLVPFSGGPTAVQSIYANNGVAPPALVARTLNTYGKLQIRSMVFRPLDPARNEGPPISTPTIINNNPYTIVVGKLEVTFDYVVGMPNMPSGLLKPRTANVTVAVGAGQIRFCYQGALSPTIGDLCPSPTADVIPGAAAICAVGGTCTPTWFVAGFNALGNPICDCRMTCASAPTYTAAAPAGGKNSGVGTLFGGALSGGATAGFGAATGGVGAGIAGAAGGPYGAAAIGGAGPAAAAAGTATSGPAAAPAAAAAAAGYVYAN